MRTRVCVFVPLFGELCKTRMYYGKGRFFRLFSSPCSGNYVKRSPSSATRRISRVFVPLFGELCKTSPRRKANRRTYRQFSSPCSGNYVKLNDEGYLTSFSHWEFSSPCSGNYVKLLRFLLTTAQSGALVFVPLFGELCKTS